MKEKFICEKIKVQFDLEKIAPVSFIWRDKEYKIKEIIESYQNYNFPKGSPKKKNWRVRHHRNYYIVKTEEEKKFKIYLDRAKHKREWILLLEYE